MIITIDNINDLQQELGMSVVRRARVINPSKERGRGFWGRLWSWIRGLFKAPKYVLLETLNIRLTNGDFITIEEGFVWDLSSVPRFLWGIFPPDGDFELAALIHDYLYRNKIKSRKFADVEMFTWSKAVAGTLNRDSWADVDNWIRYAMVRILGWIVWIKRKDYKSY